MAAVNDPFSPGKDQLPKPVDPRIQWLLHGLVVWPHHAETFDEGVLLYHVRQVIASLPNSACTKILQPIFSNVLPIACRSYGDEHPQLMNDTEGAHYKNWKLSKMLGS